jgi:hypothetical protein
MFIEVIKEVCVMSGISMKVSLLGPLGNLLMIIPGIRNRMRWMGGEIITLQNFDLAIPSFHLFFHHFSGYLAN